MNTDKNARLTPIGRGRRVRRTKIGLTPQGLAKAAGVRPRTVRKCLARFRGSALQSAFRSDEFGKRFRYSVITPFPDANRAPLRLKTRGRLGPHALGLRELARHCHT
ncbi:MAG: leucine zipper domain-containing protein [Methylocella sp.]